MPYGHNLRRKDLLIIILFLVFFAAVSFFSGCYSEEIQELVLLQGFVGMIFYISLLIVAEIVAPISFLPLLPVAVHLWGGFLAAVLSIAGWTIGAAVAFFLARRYGRLIVGKIINLEKVDEISKSLPQEHLFGAVILLRMILPVDILSYALGLFTKIGTKSYIAATVIGVSPFAFILSFGLTLPVLYQMFIASIILALSILLYEKFKKRIVLWLNNQNSSQN